MVDAVVVAGVVISLGIYKIFYGYLIVFKATMVMKYNFEETKLLL